MPLYTKGQQHTACRAGGLCLCPQWGWAADIPAVFIEQPGSRGGRKGEKRWQYRHKFAAAPLQCSSPLTRSCTWFPSQWLERLGKAVQMQLPAAWPWHRCRESSLPTTPDPPLKLAGLHWTRAKLLQPRASTATLYC